VGIRLIPDRKNEISSQLRQFSGQVVPAFGIRAIAMALSVVGAGQSSIVNANIDWADVQFEQHLHDERYHPQISRLSVQDRLRHMVLHFAKYAGRLYDAPDELQIKRTATDSLIIAISCANILNVDLSAKLPNVPSVDTTPASFANRLVVTTGRMAAACERLDHLEDFSYRVVLVEGALEIAAASIDLFNSNGWDPVRAMRERLAPVKAKSLFHGRF
jgi:hypothetical protein